MSARAQEEHPFQEVFSTHCKQHTSRYASSTLIETAQIAKDLCPKLQPGDVVTLQGTLGSGKTAFCGCLIRQLFKNLTMEISSPTFGMLHQYSRDDLQICHFDLYRLSSLDDFTMRGFVDFLHEETTVCLIEWPEIVLGHLDPKKTWVINIEMGPSETRLFTIKNPA